VSATSTVPLEELMAPRLGSVDPAAHPDEVFELYSIPACDNGAPDVLRGSQIGSAKQIVQSGDVLLSRIVPHIRRAWVVGDDRGKRIIASGEWIVFRSKRFDSPYLRHVLVSDPFHAEFMRTVSGVGGSLLRARPAYVAQIRAPLPPLPEQRRIAEILDKADALRAKRRAALAQLDTLTQSIFLDMFGDPATNPKGWPVRRLETEIDSVRYGTGSPPPYIEDGIPFIRATNIKAGTVSPKDLKRITPDDAKQLGKCRVRAGNLIVVRSGVNTGDCAIIPPDYDGACAAFDLIIDLPWANAIFYNFLINSGFGKRHLEPLTRRAAQPHLNAEQFRSLSLIAPVEEAKECFAQHIAAVNRLKTTYDASLRELDALFASLQHRAFRGEL
jgi:type I restriction enzyme, S subunit